MCSINVPCFACHSPLNRLPTPSNHQSPIITIESFTPTHPPAIYLPVLNLSLSPLRWALRQVRACVLAVCGGVRLHHSFFVLRFPSLPLLIAWHSRATMAPGSQRRCYVLVLPLTLARCVDACACAHLSFPPPLASTSARAGRGAHSPFRSPRLYFVRFSPLSLSTSPISPFVVVFTCSSGCCRPGARVHSPSTSLEETPFSSLHPPASRASITRAAGDLAIYIRLPFLSLRCCVAC